GLWRAAPGCEELALKFWHAVDRCCDRCYNNCLST
ncbi:hypothetical protein A2U01_0097353, partial [Trifolium medium]|nr:hypothetical protein [Trifolium medium]